MPAAPPRIDDDLAAALSAALVAPTTEANIAAPAPVAPAPAPAPAFAAEPAPAPVAQIPAQPAYVPSTYSAGMVAWAHGDDDIFPTTAGKKR